MAKWASTPMSLARAAPAHTDLTVSAPHVAPPALHVAPPAPPSPLPSPIEQSNHALMQKMLDQVGAPKRPGECPGPRSNSEKKHKVFDLLGVIADVTAALAAVPSFASLSEDDQYLVLSQLSRAGQADAALVRNVKCTLAELKTKKTEHARLFRLAVACAALNNNETEPAPLADRVPECSTLGQRLGLHSTTISKATQLINAGSQATLASRVLTSKVSPPHPSGAAACLHPARSPPS